VDRTCGNCKKAIPNSNLKPCLRVCFEGYGIRKVTSKACAAFEPAEESFASDETKSTVQKRGEE
jgi:hypothetical protein